MRRLAVKVLEVPKVVVSSLGLRDLVVGVWLARVDEIWELDGILDEKDGNVVSNDVPITCLHVSVQGWAADVITYPLQCRI